jgi:Domain of unknown function (DU1801)
MKAATANKEIAGLLASYPPESQDLVLATRTFVLKVVPGASEQVDVKARVIGYGFGTRYADMICSIMPTKAGVTLGIGWATELPDPEHLLKGTGKVHRHVKLKHKSDLGRPALKALLQARVAHWEKHKHQ